MNEVVELRRTKTDEKQKIKRQKHENTEI